MKRRYGFPNAWNRGINDILFGVMSLPRQWLLANRGPDTDTSRLKAFIAHYGITYPVLLTGTTGQLAEKILQGVNLTAGQLSFLSGATDW
jgi:hypothetical protein